MTYSYSFHIIHVLVSWNPLKHEVKPQHIINSINKQISTVKYLKALKTAESHGTEFPTLVDLYHLVELKRG